MEIIQKSLSNVTVVLVIGVVVLHICDYITGTIKANFKGNLTSRQMRTGATIKMLQIAGVFGWFFASWITRYAPELNSFNMILSAVAIHYATQMVASEFISIRENLIEIGAWKKSKTTSVIDEIAEKIANE